MITGLIPSLLFLSYYTHVFDTPWYYEFRSKTWSEYLPTLSGISIAFFIDGWLFPRLGDLAIVSDQEWIGSLPISLVIGVFACVGLFSMIYAKPLLFPVEYSSISEKWLDGICIQTISSNCGPCSAATILKSFGENVSIKNISQKSSTNRGGTLNWYLARTIREMGFTASFSAPETIKEVRAPAIVGVDLKKGTGHFIAVLSNQEVIEIGDPTGGYLNLTIEEFNETFLFKKFALCIGNKL